MESPRKLISNSLIAIGPLAQSAGRGADNAKVVSSTLTRGIAYFVQNNTFIIPGDTRRITRELPYWTPATHF